MNQLDKANKKREVKFKEKSFECKNISYKYQKQNYDLKLDYEKKLNDMQEKYNTQLEEQLKQLREQVKQLNKQICLEKETNRNMTNVFDKVIDLQKWNNEQRAIIEAELRQVRQERDIERIQRLERLLQTSNLLCAEFNRIILSKPKIN